MVPSLQAASRRKNSNTAERGGTLSQLMRMQKRLINAELLKRLAPKGDAKFPG
jgi:hypothetical protein